MSTGRNEPCPCGSGKKYKKCCMNKVTSITYTDEDIQFIQGQSFRHVMNHNPAVFEQYMADHLKPEVLDHLEDESQEQLFMLLFFGHYLLERNSGILEEISKAPIWSVKQRHLLKTWKNKGVFSLFTIHKWNDTEMLVSDMARGDSYEVTLPVGFPPGPAGIGFLGLVPVQGKWFSFGVPYMIAVEPEEDGTEMEEYDVFREAFKIAAREALEATASPEDFFPDILNQYYLFLEEEQSAEELTSEVGAENWTTAQQEVMDIFSEKAEEELREGRGIEAAKAVWNHYCTHASPTIRKPEVFAAALEYYLSKHYVQGSGITQKKVSEKYGVSPNTISKRSQDINEALTNEVPQA